MMQLKSIWLATKYQKAKENDLSFVIISIDEWFLSSSSTFSFTSKENPQEKKGGFMKTKSFLRWKGGFKKTRDLN